MKEYIRTAKQVFAVQWKELLNDVVYGFGAAILGIIMVIVIMAWDGTYEDYGKLGCFLVLVVGFIIFFVGGFFGEQSYFNLAMSMGKTRKAYLSVRYLMYALDVAIVLAISMVTGKIEDILYTSLYPNAVCELDVPLVDYPVLCVALVLLLPIVVLLGNLLFMKFGSKFAWTLWALWMIFAFGIIQFAEEFVHTNSEKLEQMASTIGTFSDKIGSVGLIGITVALTVAGMALLRRLYHRQQVTL